MGGGNRMKSNIKIGNDLPLYEQMKEVILKQIESGELKAGDKILSEAQFQKEFHVSRITVRKAIEALVKEGYLMKIQGKGTFVKKHNQSLQQCLSLTDLCQIQGRSLTSEIISCQKCDVKKENLRFFSHQQNIEIVRLRKVDGVVIMLETTYFPLEDDFLLNEDLSHSLYQLLNQYHIYPDHKGLNEVSISKLTPLQAQLFNVQNDMNVIHHRGVIYDENHRFIHAVEEYVRVDLPDLFKYYL